MPADKHPDACIGCGSCAAVCPQQIDIPEALADFAELMKD
jgi:predicted aldo/keto reductase-like oxidoreductase